MTSAILLLLISMLLCVIGAYVSVFAVTTYKNLNAWVSVSFLFGAMVNVTYLLILIYRPQ